MSEINIPKPSYNEIIENPENGKLMEAIWNALQNSNLVDLQKVRPDLMTWRRGSAQLVLRVNPQLDNLSIYSVLVAKVKPSEALYKHLLSYNVLQRRESLGMIEKDGETFITLKYTMEINLANEDVLQRHVFALQEIADELDTELVNKFGGILHFDDWKKLDQKSVDSMIVNLFS